MNASIPKNWVGFFSVIVQCFFLMSTVASADPALDVVIGRQNRQFGRNELLHRPDLSQVTVTSDVTYGNVTTSYRALPLAALLLGFNPPGDTVIESVALDGFVAQLPFDILTNTDPAKAIAWLAIEPDDRPWPRLPGKALSAGPFYIVWTGATAAMIRSEQWPYRLKRLEKLTVTGGTLACARRRSGIARN